MTRKEAEAEAEALRIRRLLDKRIRYDEEIVIKTALDLYKQGCTHTEVRAKLRISENAFYYWKKQHLAFKKAVEYGNELSAAWWLEQLRINIENPKFNVSAWTCGYKYRKLSVRNLIGTTEERMELVENAYDNNEISYEDYDRLMNILQSRKNIIEASEINQRLAKVEAELTK